MNSDMYVDYRGYKFTPEFITDCPIKFVEICKLIDNRTSVKSFFTNEWLYIVDNEIFNKQLTIKRFPRIEILNQPRQSGKTTKLKERILELIRTDEDIIILGGHNPSHLKEMIYSEFSKTKSKCNITITNFSNYKDLIKGQRSIHIIIDELFDVDLHQQIDFIKELKNLEDLNINYSLYGTGTLYRTKVLFKDFIV